MPERNTPRRRWNRGSRRGLPGSQPTHCAALGVSEGLPVHRREHEKQQTVFAFRHELEACSRLRTKCLTQVLSIRSRRPLLGQADRQRLPLEHDATARTMIRYIAGRAQATQISCARPSILRQRSPATARESSTQALSNTCSSGSPERSCAEDQFSLCTHRDHREHRDRPSGSPALVW